MTAREWTYKGYWNAVLGDKRDAATLVAEFGLDARDERGLDEWLGRAEAAAWAVSAEADDGEPMPGEWTAHHARALAELLCVEVPS